MLCVCAVKKIIMKILRLTLKKKWFDLILSGEKKEEYREFKDYWIKRFGYNSYSSSDPADNGYYDAEMKNLPDAIEFVNGYSKTSPRFIIEVNDWNVAKSKHPEWGGDTDNIQFIFKLGEIIPNH
jgi:hypothetical protein